MRRVGIDPGQRRTGLALCEEELRVAIPAGTVSHASFEQAVTRVAEALVDLRPDEIVVGLPLRLDGSEGQAARQARRFAGALQARVQLPIVLWDERLSTVAAERALREQGVTGRSQRKVVDQAAATIVLQSYLDAQAGEGDDCRDDLTALDLPAPMPMEAHDRGRARRGRRRGGKP